MSKEAAQRAMREARYAERMAHGSTGIPATRPPVAPPPGSPAATPRTAAKKSAAAPAAGSDVAGSTAADSATEALCGHKSMNGRTCTREHGHTAKSHRYS